jgi:hypothetical protein
MHYLKCNRCGKLVEVKTEYLIFCPFCDKKLTNCYSSWKEANNDKTFDDFKQLVCISEDDLPKEKQKSKFNTKKGLKYWAIFTICFACFYAIGQLGGERIAQLFRKPSFDKAMMEYASEINKHCPIMIDNVTRLENAIALPDNIFQYNYTIINSVKDSINVEGLKNYLEPSIVNFVKTNPDMKIVRDNKTTISYYYKDKNGVYLFTISVKPEQYE